MKEIVVRTLSGILYVTLLVVAIYNPLVLYAVLFIFGFIALNELKRLLNSNSTVVVYAVFIVLYFGLVYLQLTQRMYWLQTVVTVLSSISIIVNSVLIKNLYAVHTSSYHILNKIVLATFYCCFPFIYLFVIPYFKDIYYPELLLGCFIITWSNDTFAYVVGRFFGKTKLFERISPKKTIEGFVGGVVFSLVTAYVLSLVFNVLDFKYWIVIALLISILGSLGDLVESKMKRQAHVKDSGNIMPGHGGVLDRLDSIIFVAPFIYMFLYLLQHLS